MNSDIQQKIEAFFAAYPERVYAKSQLLIHAEETPPGVFYITEGRVSQYDITNAGNEIVVNVFKPGAFFPMSTAINSTPNHYFFEASSAVVARQAPMSDAVQFLKENPDVVFDLLSRVYRGVDGVLRRMAHLMGGEAKTRLVFELLNAAYRFGELQPDGSIRISLTENDVARHSGLARETVNRILRELKAAQLVTITRSNITIASTKGLEATLGNNL